MKKIKKKKTSKSRISPAYVIGFTHGDPPPPGYLAAWFDQQYGGPLKIQFLSQTGHANFEAMHTHWRARINMNLDASASQIWREQLHWQHSSIAEVFSGANGGQSKLDSVLHVARLARGLTLLTEGTAYDVAARIYCNPSDWQDQPLTGFSLLDHVQIGQTEKLQEGQVWFYTQGLSKFGLDELECLRPVGLSENGVKEMLEESAEYIVHQGNVPKIGAEITLPFQGQVVKIVRHRTDQSFGRPIAFREIRWSS
ncbi:MAG: DUF4261 domain-containing protein [Nitrospirales bacterium]|nr:hypothetical protein [Nitrospira sp.]MDR4501415.1 DUF4261 domain-containing protein [Nitrospirales bacterium]